MKKQKISRNKRLSFFLNDNSIFLYHKTKEIYFIFCFEVNLCISLSIIDFFKKFIWFLYLLITIFISFILCIISVSRVESHKDIWGIYIDTFYGFFFVNTHSLSYFFSIYITLQFNSQYTLLGTFSLLLVFSNLKYYKI